MGNSQESAIRRAHRAAEHAAREIALRGGEKCGVFVRHLHNAERAKSAAIRARGCFGYDLEAM